MRLDNDFIKRTIPNSLFVQGTLPENVTFAIDSRMPLNGSIFVAIKGATHDGHDFIEQAFENGALGIMITESKKEILNKIQNVKEKCIILVPDTLQALIALAKSWREKFTYPVIAITGSVGKTSTKELLAQIMAASGKKIVASYENQNTKLGIALNILRMRTDHEFAIFEVGISKRGEMADIAAFLHPTTALITNIGHQHMDGLGSLNDIALEKRDIFKYFIHDSIGIINGDQSILASVSYQHPVIKFGSKTTNQIQARKIRVSGSHISFVMKIYKNKYPIVLSYPHSGAVFNVLAATTIAHWVGIPDDIIVKSVQRPCIITGRFEECAIVGGGILINDCYNANPESMKAALLAFQQIETKSPKIAVLGDMLGLGVNSPFWHRQVGRFLRKVPSLNKVILVGHFVSWIKKTAPLGLSVECAASWKDVIEKIEPELRSKPAILVKGSRALGLDNIVHAFTQEK